MDGEDRQETKTGKWQRLMLLDKQDTSK